MPDFKAAARNLRLGPKHKIEALDGALVNGESRDFHFQPQKFSLQQRNEIRRLMIERGSHASPEVQRILKEKQTQWHEEHPESADEPSLPDLQYLLSDEEWEKIMAMFGSVMDDIEITRLTLLYGIGPHDLTEDSAVDEDLVADIMDVPEVAEEMVGVINEWSRPLAQTSGSNLETQSTGPTTEPGSR